MIKRGRGSTKVTLYSFNAFFIMKTTRAIFTTNCLLKQEFTQLASLYVFAGILFDKTFASYKVNSKIAVLY